MPSIDSGQLSLFNSDGAAPQVDDLDGLLLGTGHFVRREDGARVSVLVDDSWRAIVLLREFEERGIAGEVESSSRHLVSVRTEFSGALSGLAARWDAAGIRAEPARRVSAAALRLWVIASGRPDAVGYLLRLAPSEQHRWERSGSALSALGVTGTLLGPRAGGPAYRISGPRRLKRLIELIGPLPADAPADFWPHI